MRRINIEVPVKLSKAVLFRAVQRVLERSDLQITSRGTLKTYPGSTHWHLKNRNARGTLELTWWPAKRELWLKVQAGRDAPWIRHAARQLKKEIEGDLPRRC